MKDKYIKLKVIIEELELQEAYRNNAIKQAEGFTKKADKFQLEVDKLVAIMEETLIESVAKDYENETG